MIFNKHTDLLGLHAVLSPSKYHWTGYDEDRLISFYNSYLAIERGNQLHEFAANCIRLRRKQPKTKDVVNAYINDAIGFNMKPEQPLFYSVNAFGTCDAIAYKEKEKCLRIHDLKTGVSRVSIKQLEIYAALFFLEYRLFPKDVHTELRIYQTENLIVENPEPEIILDVMDKIITFDKIITKLRMEEEL